MRNPEVPIVFRTIGREKGEGRAREGDRSYPAEISDLIYIPDRIAALLSSARRHASC